MFDQGYLIARLITAISEIGRRRDDCLLRSSRIATMFQFRVPLTTPCTAGCHSGCPDFIDPTPSRGCAADMSQVIYHGSSGFSIRVCGSVSFNIGAKYCMPCSGSKFLACSLTFLDPSRETSILAFPGQAEISGLPPVYYLEDVIDKRQVQTAKNTNSTIVLIISYSDAMIGSSSFWVQMLTGRIEFQCAMNDCIFGLYKRSQMKYRSG
ncbi:hypothetical protein BDW22DRAFT_578992 [Trametopsis cervina]|nr:hypothetical protein BDW22DRAFT_578992 [Trametopsis cervina]